VSRETGRKPRRERRANSRIGVGLILTVLAAIVLLLATLQLVLR